MASFRLNIAALRDCPPPDELGKALEAYALPAEEEFGVLNCSVTPQAVFGTIVRKLQQAVQRLDVEAREITAAAVEKVQVYPFAVHPKSQRLEVYTGSGTALEQMGAFLGSSLGLPTSVEPIEVDVVAAIDRLAETTERFQLRAVRVNEYAHNSFMSGPYAPKFLDSEHGRDFLREYAEFIASAALRFSMPMGKANVRLAPQACFSFSCHEEDRPSVQAILRKLT